jgi:GH24 family phage-related lysozyme (muramidase)
MATTKQKAAAAAIAASIAIPCEGLRQWAYQDPPGIWTVCYGSTANVERGRKYSLEECKARLNADMLHAVDAVDRCQPGLPENVLAAFADAAYNIGSTVVCDKTHSTAARKLAAKDYRGACLELPKWDKARVAGAMVSLPGLTKRRNLEKDLCLEGLS